MFKKNKIKFIKNAGGSIVSNNILNGKGKIKWIFREKSVNQNDNGWRFLSNIDDDQYINNPSNLIVCDYNTVAEIEPAIISIYLLPVGTDLEFVIENNKKYFLDNLTGKVVKTTI